MMRELTRKAPAKINWGLDIVGKRADGYHLLRSLMQSVSLFDEVSLRAGVCDGCRCEPALPDGGDNLALRAWLLLKAELGVKDGLDIRIRKRIPVAGGLAGGSTDAAAVLLGANRLFGLGLDLAALCRIGLKLGADLPFCLTGGLALVEGIGEQVTPLAASHTYHLLLANPGCAVSTAAVYRGFSLDKAGAHPNIGALRQALLAGDAPGIARHRGNMLEPPAFALQPEIAALKQRCITLGLPALMSGSGGSVWALARDEAQAVYGAETLRREYPFACAVRSLAALPGND